MAKLFYGNGNCAIEGSGIKGVEIIYKGNITEISDNTSNGFVLLNNDHKILIFPIPTKKIGSLNNLFDYSGSIRINSVIGVNSGLKKEKIFIKAILDYSELIFSNSEDMTVNSENMDATYYSNKKIKAQEKQSIITNLNTNSEDIRMYLKNGEEYLGPYHIHLGENPQAMTGENHTSESLNLYYKKVDFNGIMQNKIQPLDFSNLVNKRNRNRGK